MLDDEPMLELEGDKKKGKVAKREPLEKDIENAVCKYARDRYGMKAEKFTSPGRRAVPDRLFTVPCRRQGGFMFLIEFKAPGKKPTEKQVRDHLERQRMGCKVFVVDDIDRGKKIVDVMYAFASEL